MALTLRPAEKSRMNKIREERIRKFVQVVELLNTTEDPAAGVPLNNVDEATFRRITKGERDRRGNLIWLREDGDRR